MENKENILKIIVGIVLVAVIVLVLVAGKKNSELRNDNAPDQQKVEDTNNDTSSQNNDETYPSFARVIINEGMVDKIYRYTYEGNTYFYMSGWEKVDGTPQVYTELGQQVECNFKSPMIPVQPGDELTINPACRGYLSGTLVYDRN